MEGDFYLKCRLCGKKFLIPKIFHNCVCPKCRKGTLEIIYDDNLNKIWGAKGYRRKTEE